MIDKSRTDQFVDYWNGILRHKLYAIVSFIGGVGAAMISKEAILMVFISLFIVPSLFAKR